ncbi:hypothetical protein DITRI_Ditri09bG0029100 [Diplodiscus trichospermus]
MAVIVFTTPGNRPFIAKSLADTSASILDIPYPENIPGIPTGVNSIDALPSIHEAMQPEFERKLQSVLPVSFMVSNWFLWWTLESATKFGFPRLMFSSMSQYASCVSKAVSVDRLLSGPESDDELITVTQFPRIKVTSNDFDPKLSKPADPNNTKMKLSRDRVISASKSYGYIVNSFYEMEKFCIDRWNSEERPKVWCVGPLCLAEPPKFEHEPQKERPSWIKWLDEKLDQGCSVLYVAFGSQAEISSEQLKQIAIGLEQSKVNFLWVIRKKESELCDGYEERVKERHCGERVG